MSCLGTRPLIGGKSKAGVEGQHDNRVMAGGKRQNEQEESSKRRQRSRRKINNQQETDRILRWKENAQAWKESINQDQQVIIKKVQERGKRFQKQQQNKPI